MKEIADKTRSRTGVIITLIIGLAIGSVCTASIISLLTNSMDLWLAYTILVSIFIVSTFFIFFWIFKKELFEKIFGVELKDFSVLLHDIVEDISENRKHNIKLRAYEAAVVWTTLKTRIAFIGLLVFLATALFLMLNAYVMFRQNDLIMQQIEIMGDEKEIIEKQVEIAREEKIISEFKLTEKILDLVRSHSKDHRDIITTISNCGKVYNVNGGAHNYQEINNYLAFIEDFSIYEKDGFFRIEKINDLFGFYFLAFYRNNDGEIKRYITDVRNNVSSLFYSDLLSLMNKLEALPSNKNLIQVIDKICGKKP